MTPNSDPEALLPLLTKDMAQAALAERPFPEAFPFGRALRAIADGRAVVVPAPAPAATPGGDGREEFEAWVRSRISKKSQADSMLWRDNNGNYVYAQSEWEAWQAARSQSPADRVWPLHIWEGKDGEPCKWCGNPEVGHFHISPMASLRQSPANRAG